MKLVVIPALLKAHVKAYTRKDGAFVQEHDDKRQAAAPKPSGGYSVAPFKHGGHQIKEPDGTHHVILHDKGVADRHAAALNHVAQAGKDGHMNEAIHAAAKKHMGLDSFDEVGSDRADFVDTGKTGLKRALHHAYDAGAGHSKGGAHRDAVVAEAGKHFGHFDTLDEAGNDGADFKEVSKGSLKHALKHAYASGAQKAASKPAAAKKPAGPKPGHMDVSTLAEGHHLFDKSGQKVDEVESVEKHPMGGLRVNTRAGYSHMVGKDGRNDHGLTNKAPGGSVGPMNPDAVKEHAMKAGAKFKSGVSVFSKPESAHSFASMASGSKGSAFVMKHPDYSHHVVVNGADAQRMEKNGYQHARPGQMQKSMLLVRSNLLK